MHQPKRTRSLRRSSGKKSGAQAGHEGHRLEVAEKPDEVKQHAVTICSECQASLENVAVERVEKRQEYELPPIHLVVTEHQAEVKCCPQCGHENQAEFPVGITQPTQYGPNFKAFLVYLNQKQFVPVKRMVEICADMLGQAVGEGTIVEASHEVAQVIEPVNQQIQAHLIETEDPVHFDESSLRVKQKNYWVHSAGTEQATYYHLDEKRGTIGIDNAGILPNRLGNSKHILIFGWSEFQRRQFFPTFWRVVAR